MINAWTRFVQRVPDVDAALDFYVDTQLKNEPWGIRQYVIEDLNSYHVRIGEEHEPDEGGQDLAVIEG